MKKNKIILTGPESSGKTTLAEELAQYFRVPLAYEYARGYLEKNGADYAYDEVKVMLDGQLSLERRMEEESNDFIICDTDLLTYLVWYNFKFGITQQWILDQLSTYEDRVYLLCYPESKWEEDPVREHPEDRMTLYQMYEDALSDLNLTYHIMQGDPEFRKNEAISIVQQL